MDVAEERAHHTWPLMSEEEQKPWRDAAKEENDRRRRARMHEMEYDEPEPIRATIEKMLQDVPSTPFTTTTSSMMDVDDDSQAAPQSFPGEMPPGNWSKRLSAEEDQNDDNEFAECVDAFDAVHVDPVPRV